MIKQITQVTLAVALLISTASAQGPRPEGRPGQDPARHEGRGHRFPPGRDGRYNWRRERPDGEHRPPRPDGDKPDWDPRSEDHPEGARKHGWPRREDWSPEGGDRRPRPEGRPEGHEGHPIWRPMHDDDFESQDDENAELERFCMKFGTNETFIAGDYQQPINANQSENSTSESGSEEYDNWVQWRREWLSENCKNHSKIGGGDHDNWRKHKKLNCSDFDDKGTFINKGNDNSSDQAPGHGDHDNWRLNKFRFRWWRRHCQIGGGDHDDWEKHRDEDRDGRPDGHDDWRGDDQPIGGDDHDNWRQRSDESTQTDEEPGLLKRMFSFF